MANNLTLTCEDNMELMARYPDKHFGLAIVDPPYRDINSPTKDMRKKNNGDMKKFGKKPKEEYFTELIRISKNQIIFGANNFPILWSINQSFIFWYKGNPLENFSDGELAWTSFNKVAKQFDFRYYGNLQGNTSAVNKIHPTQKPIELYKWLLYNYAKEGDKILDTHLGSMSIAIACYDMGFDLVGCELNPDYYAEGMKRVNNHMKQLTIF